MAVRQAEIPTTDPTRCNGYGGITVETGIDDNGNGVLDAAEVDATQIVCNGAPGATGVPGSAGSSGASALANATAVAANPTANNGVDGCISGGIKIEIGLDDGTPSGTAGNGILEKGEIDQTWYVCNCADLTPVVEVAPLADALPTYDSFPAPVFPAPAGVDNTLWDNAEGGVVVVPVQPSGNAVMMMARTINAFTSQNNQGGAQVVLESKTQADKFQATFNVLQWSRANAAFEVRLRLMPLPKATSGSQLNIFAANATIRSNAAGTGLEFATGYTACSDATCTVQHSPLNQSGTLSSTAIPLTPGAPQTLIAGLDRTAGAEKLYITFGGNTRALDISPFVAGGQINLAGTDVVPRIQARIRNGDAFPLGGSGQFSLLVDDVLLNDVLYDDFNSGLTLDGAKWQGGINTRQIAAGKLAVYEAVWGDTASNSLSVRTPARAGAMAADVTVTDYDASNLASATAARARVAGVFYNDGSTGDGLGGQNGDIHAEIGMSASRVLARVTRCVTYQCDTTQPLPTTPIDMGPVALGETHTLYLEWDGARFVFQRDKSPPVTFDPVAAGATVASPTPRAFGNTRVIGTRISVAGGTESGSIRALFGNVRIGAGGGNLGNALPAYEEFNGRSGVATNMSPFRWADPVTQTELISGGKLVTTINRPGAPTIGHTWVDRGLPDNNTVRGISADVSGTFGGANYIAGGPWGQFYVDSAGDRIGASVRVTNGGTVDYVVFTCSVGGGCGSTVLASGSLGAITGGSTHNLSMHWNGGAVFTFALDAASTPIDVSGSAPFASVLAPGDYWIGFEIYADNAAPNSTTTATVTYDNVRTSSDNNSATAFVLHDDFSGATIDPAKWSSQETLRLLQSGQLRLTGSPNGPGLGFPGAYDVLAMSFDMTVTDDSGTNLGAGGFLALGSDSGCTDYAIISVGQGQARLAVIRGDACGAQVLAQQALGPVTLGTSHTYYVGWDKATGAITAQIDNQAPVREYLSELGLFFGLGPVAANSGSGLASGLAFGSPTPAGSISALFDNVRARIAPRP
ncbi:MAG: hypothetical protein HY423_09005 [Candidatus Lambdaproteobacteria bacterium]|nr:hypothetical protein [Candidatus Lambdaproteobacteria bacterium]